MAELIFRDEVYAIQGAIFDVYKEMGNMWTEEVYQQCLELELNYLMITGLHLGLLINFGAYPKVEIERFAL